MELETILKVEKPESAVVEFDTNQLDPFKDDKELPLAIKSEVVEPEVIKFNRG